MESITTPLPHSLAIWGWDGGWANAFDAYARAGLVPARVVAQHRGRWTVATDGIELAAAPSGRFRYENGEDALPAVGDWVACAGSVRDGAPAASARIEAVLPRRSVFRRRAAGPRATAQTIAANVDTLLVATSLNHDLNPRRLERYVTMARESGAEPVVVLTKADLSDDPDGPIERLGRELHVAVVALSAATGDGVEALGEWLVPGRTVALVGSSGVGKSTLLNRLAGEELMTTRDIREDDARGRHTTTHRELFRLADGVLVLDTPGMRELGLWDADDGLAETFADIEEIESRCRFSDCRHQTEPGCAIQAALATGELDARRLQSYRRLARELAAQPSPAERRDASKRFFKAVRNASAESMARKTYAEDGGRRRR